MKHLLSLSLIFLAHSLVAMDGKNSQAMQINSDKSEQRRQLMVSRSPEDWCYSEPFLAARQAHASMEHQESAKKSNAVHVVTFMSDQSLTLIDRLKEELKTSSGHAQIDEKLEEMLEQMKESDIDDQEEEKPLQAVTNNSAKTINHTSDVLASQIKKNPDLRKKMDAVIALQALFLNQVIRFLEEKK